METLLQAKKKGVFKIKNIHETQSTDQANTGWNEEDLYSPVENLQKIEAGGVIKRNSFDISKFPKGIRYLAYFLFSGIFIIILLVLIINFIYS
ncbi:hypothetical protein [Heyndrickxia oleronia]|uniref:hypothetical protein n=1 Tax=Heyndrickxia oleronia TaxID=38875 RepID=UPI0007173433|nr:hypothetical protein [Heyndrickxia oleronia]MBU5210714.1 hypothetical protein [Heyndrickxia oleronia]